LRILPQQRCGQHQHAGGAEAALEAPAFPECLLLGAQGAVLGSQALNRFNTRTVNVEGKRGTGSYGKVINQNSAGTADTPLTRSTDPLLTAAVAQQIQDRSTRRDATLFQASIQLKLDLVGEFFLA